MKLNIFFKCKNCTGTGWIITTTTPCPVCKGSGKVLHQFVDVIKVEQFPECAEVQDAEFSLSKELNAPNPNSN